MEGSCSTGQSPQRAVVPVEEEEEEVYTISSVSWQKTAGKICIKKNLQTHILQTT
jgi:hypothetical protein